MKTLSTLLCIVFLTGFDPFCLYAQDPTQEWVRTYDGPAATFDEGNSVTYDSNDGTILVAGRGWDTEGGVNVFVVKYNSAGDLIWDYIWDGPSSFDDQPWDIVVASNGNVYVCGQTKTGTGYWDSNMFLLALNSSGEYLWEDDYGLYGEYLDIAYEIRLDFNENICIVGNDSQGETNNLYGGGLMLRYTPQGVIDWTIHLNSSTEWPFQDGLSAIDIDINQNVILGGASTILNNFYDMVCMSYNQAGDQNWLHTNPGPLNDVTESFVDVEADVYGNVFALGYNSISEWEIVKYDADGLILWNYIMEDLFANWELGIDYMHADGDGNLYFAVTANGDIYLTKLSPAGEVIWQSIWASPLGFGDDMYQLTWDLAGNIYIAGNAGIANSYFDMIMLKYDTDGNLVWDVNFEGPAANNDEAHGMYVDPSGSVLYLVGYSRGFTPNADLTVVKYSTIVSVDETSQPDFSVYPNPSQNFLRIQSATLNPATNYLIYNSLGEIVLQGTLKESLVDTQTLPNGVYYVKVNGAVRKVVKGD